MKTPKIFTVLTVIAVILTSLFSFVSTAFAQPIAPATVGTSMTIKPPVSVTVGNPAVVVIHLVSSKGQPVANQPVELLVDGERERRARTDADGNVSIRVRRDEAGTYQLQAYFKGSKSPSLGSSRASAELVIKPEVIEIHTTPALPDIKFSLDGEIFATDDYGVARVEAAKAGTYRIEILPVEIGDPDLQMDFGRWGDESFTPSRDIVVPLNKRLEVGFDVHYQVGQTFIDLEKEPVAPERITSITYKGSNGATITFEDMEPHWLPAGRVIRRSNGLEETKILWSVISVVIDGTNVVSQAQQRFYANPNDVWTIQVLLYSAHFTARDALFGFPIGTGIRMEYPDGEVQEYTFDTEKGQTIDKLARGIYKVTVTGGNGYAPPTPIALSRSQDVELLVFSYLDIGVILGVGLFLSVGLLLIGRPYLVGNTINGGRRIIARRRELIPAVRTQFQKLPALGSRLLSRRKAGEQRAEGQAFADLQAPTAEEKDALPSAILDAARDLHVKDKNEVENPA